MIRSAAGISVPSARPWTISMRPLIRSLSTRAEASAQYYSSCACRRGLSSPRGRSGYLRRSIVLSCSFPPSSCEMMIATSSLGKILWPLDCHLCRPQIASDERIIARGFAHYREPAGTSRKTLSPVLPSLGQSWIALPLAVGQHLHAQPDPRFPRRSIAGAKRLPDFLLIRLNETFSDVDVAGERTIGHETRESFR
jgi:hypothetical protein